MWENLIHSINLGILEIISWLQSCSQLFWRENSLRFDHLWSIIAERPTTYAIRAHVQVERCSNLT
jgi:hypothetical protein